MMERISRTGLLSAGSEADNASAAYERQKELHMTNAPRCISARVNIIIKITIITYVTVIHVDDRYTLCRDGHVDVLAGVHQVGLLGQKLFNPHVLRPTDIRITTCQTACHQ